MSQRFFLGALDKGHFLVPTLSFASEVTLAQARLKLLLGGFADLQHLKGGEQSNIIWPDNELNIYGGDIGVKYLF